MPNPRPHSHAVQFYWNDSTLEQSIAHLLGDALAAGDAAILIATPRHRARVLSLLGECGLDGACALRGGCLLLLDARTVLDRISDQHGPSRQRFTRSLGSRVDQLSCGRVRRVTVFDEMVAELWGDGRPGEALAVERLWNELAETRNFDLLCAYPMKHFARLEDGELFLQVCAAHTAVLPGAPAMLQRIQAPSAARKAAAMASAWNSTSAAEPASTMTRASFSVPE